MLEGRESIILRLHRWLLAAAAAAAVVATSAQGISPLAKRGSASEMSSAAGAEESARPDEPIKLPPIEVKASSEEDAFDETGMGSYEYQLRELPFSNDMISVEAIEDDPVAMEMAEELTAIATPSAVDLATGDSRISLRGFPTPQMSNGFVRMGGLDILNTARTIVIQGALVPVLGRAAPGGIRDFLSRRPRARAGQSYNTSVSSLQRQSAAFEITGVMVPRRTWHSLSASWSRKVGPQAFASSEILRASGAITWRLGPRASTLFSVTHQEVAATAAPGIPAYREATGRKIVGPYLPLAFFNSFGPDAGVERTSTVATVLLDAQPHPKIALRAGVEERWRRLEQDRFTTSLLNLTTGRFEGTREPRHSEQPQHARAAHMELTGRFAALGGQHKLMLAASHTAGEYHREELALPVAVRNALPASARFFDPTAPDYTSVPFSREVYTRVLTDRSEFARYTSLEMSERMSIAGGRLVLTTGLRHDFVGLKIEDRRVGAAQANVTDAVDQVTYHGGLNYQAVPSRLLLFTTASTAFEPSTRVDGRTGRIQGNETTRGYEGGLKARFPARQVDLTLSGFTFFNEAISRRNPLYDDPIHDANQTQPQLVAAGEERFTGGKVEGRWKVAPPLSLSLRGTYVRAITTASPDIPEEVGRPLTRLPPYTASAGLRYSFAQGNLRGLSFGANWNYISKFTAQYENAQRHALAYPGYGMVSTSVGYSRKVGRYTHGFGLGVRNVLDRDLLITLARVGAGREFTGNYRLMF